MTLWCFGDSYASTYDDTNWTSQVAQYLKCEQKNFALAATSLEYMYSTFDDAEFETNDHLIIALTDIHRTYFFKEQPQASMPPQIMSPSFLKLLSSEKKFALNQYYMYLTDNALVRENNLKNFLYRVQYVTEKKNLTTIVFNCFYEYDFINADNYPNLVLVPGLLESINSLEVSGTGRFFKYTSEIGTDLRANHMCQSNHNILASKVIDYYNSNTTIILDNFVKHLITDENYKDPLFQDKEFSKTKIEVFNQCSSSLK